MRIGELGRHSGVEPTAIRYYERIGLMPPPIRSQSGYRDYGDDACTRLDFIRAAQSVGLTLDEIRETLAFRDRGEAPCHHVAALIEQHAAKLRERIAMLETMQRELDRLARKARTPRRGDASEVGFCPIIGA